MNAVVRASRVRELYDSLPDTTPHGKVGWSSREVQHTRHAVIARLLPNFGSILDVGCGLGDLIQAIPASLEYCGIDFNFAFIVEAKSRHPSQHFYCSDALDWHLPFDVVVASGTLAGYDSSDILHITRHLFHLANNGLIFNWFNRDESDATLRLMASALAKVITANPATIVTGYTPGDVTIMLSHA